MSPSPSPSPSQSPWVERQCCWSRPMIFLFQLHGGSFTLPSPVSSFSSPVLCLVSPSASCPSIPSSSKFCNVPVLPPRKTKLVTSLSLTLSLSVYVTICVFMLILAFPFVLSAAATIPVLQNQHQLLVTLLLCNACAMEVLYSSLSHYNFLFLQSNLSIECPLLLISAYLVPLLLLGS